MVTALPRFKLVRPETIDLAIAELAGNASATLCAGGTDLIVNMRHGLGDFQTLVDISQVKDIQKLKLDGYGLRIGAGVKLSELAQNKAVARAFPVIHQACIAIAGPTHRNCATVGGNLCLDTRCLFYNQSRWWRKSNDYCLKYRGTICHVAPKGNRCRAAFTSDLAPALIACGAEIEITGPGGKRTLDLRKLYREDGADHLKLEPQEILTAVSLNTSAENSAYRKIKVRGAMDFPLAGVAVVCHQKPVAEYSFSIAVTGTNSCPVVIDVGSLKQDVDREEFFAGLNKLVQKSVSPQRTTTIAPHYRRLAIAAVTVRLAKALSGEGLK